jgi:hypothetical protein
MFGCLLQGLAGLKEIFSGKDIVNTIYITTNESDSDDDDNHSGHHSGPHSSHHTDSIDERKQMTETAQSITNSRPLLLSNQSYVKPLHCKYQRLENNLGNGNTTARIVYTPIIIKKPDVNKDAKIVVTDKCVIVCFSDRT